MLGSLQSDLNKLGVATVAKGVCGACKKPIAGQVMMGRGGAGEGAAGGHGDLSCSLKGAMWQVRAEPHSASVLRS